MFKNNLKFHLILLIFIAIGCKQQEELTKSIPNQKDIRKIALSEAKDYYFNFNKKSNRSEKIMASNTTASTSTISLIGDPNWNVSNIYNLADTIIIIKVPLTNYVVDHSYSNSMNHLGYRELVFQKNISGEVRSQVLEVHPDLAYLQQQQQSYPTATLQDYSILVKNENFTGFVLTFDLNNNLLSGLHKTSGLTDLILN